MKRIITDGRTKQGRKVLGFTLIELLVVIAIISILAAILFPVFARARENARRSNCASNQKQLTLAVMQYTQDNDERLPGTLWNYNPPYVTWMNRIHPYLKSTELFKCPSDDSLTVAGGLSTTTTSYCYNYYYLNETGLTASSGGFPLASIANVSQTVIFAERGGVASGVTRYVCGYSASLNIPTAPHLEGGNFAFIDGHVKWYPFTNSIYRSATLWDRT